MLEALKALRKEPQHPTFFAGPPLELVPAPVDIVARNVLL
jgi:hypothetical protein